MIITECESPAGAYDAVNSAHPQGTGYTVACGPWRAEISAEQARTMWDAWPAWQRTGSRTGAFILWEADELGRRHSPIIFRILAADRTTARTPAAQT